MKFFLHQTAVVDKGATIGEGTKIWHHAHIREGARIGKKCIIGKNVYIDSDSVVGSGVKIENNTCIYNSVLEDNVLIGPGVIITNDLYPRAFIWNDDKKGDKTIIKKGASIGANSTVICGVVVGEYAIIGAGSVVTKGVPPHTLAYGNPAKIHAFVCKCGNKLDAEKSEESDGVFVIECNKCKEKISIPIDVFKQTIKL